MMKLKGMAGISALATLLTSGSALAAQSDEWTYHAEIYALAADVGITSARGQSATAEFADILDDLEFAIFGSLAAKRDKLAFIINMLYVDVESNKTNTRGAVTSHIDVELETFVSTLAAGWELYGSESSSFYGVVGTRLLSLETSLNIQIDPLGQAGESQSSDNWDAVIGVQGRTDFSSDWYLSYYADMGKGDSDFTWQASASLGYRFSPLDIALGYQYLEWQFDDELLADLQIHGPALGLRFHW